MFERSLSSLIKGLRSHRGKDEARYVATLMEEIKHEVRSGDMDVKAEAVLKLTYLQMLGYAPSDASFHMLEVMASPKLHLKQVGYLAATQCFDQDTEVLILATNMIKKDLRSPSPLDVAVALNGLSHIITPDLAKHLASDVIALLTHTKPGIRKRALLVLHSIILHYPAALEQSLGRLSEKLEDADGGVISSAVNILCELARRDESLAKAFLPLSPQLFHLLTSSTNNWMLIKIVKLFGVLTPLEPRLAKRLSSPISTIISTTPAMSLLYECMHTVIIGGMLEFTGGDELAETCSEKLGVFLDDDDQNLRYIALLAMVKILPTHPHLVAIHQEAIFECMNDEDLSIRLRALDLVSGMASRSNFVDIVNQQLLHLEPVANKPEKTRSASQALQDALNSNGPVAGSSEAPVSASWISSSYRLEIINRILDVGSTETYTNIVDFEWYVDVLIRLNHLVGDSVGHRIQWQLIDIASRVRAVRPHATHKLKQELENVTSIQEQSETAESLQIFRAAAWICGEYGQHIAYPPAVVLLLLGEELSQACDQTTLAMLVQNAMKLFAWWLLEIGREWSADKLDDVRKMTQEVKTSLQRYQDKKADVELRERVSEFTLLLKILERDLDASKDAFSSKEEDEQPKPKSLQLLSPLFFGHALGPVSRKAQSKVTVPQGLDLSVSFIDTSQITLIDEWTREDEEAKATVAAGKTRKKATMSTDNDQVNGRKAEARERLRLRQEREQRERESPFYLGSKVSSAASEGRQRINDEEIEDDDIDNIPIVQLQLDEPPTGQAIEKPAPKVAPQPPRQEEEEEPDEAAYHASPVIRKAVTSKKKRKSNRSGGISEKTLLPSD